MTTLQWIAEFKNELYQLQHISKRIFALIQLHPRDNRPGDDMRAAFHTVEQESLKSNRYQNESLLQHLYKVMDLRGEPQRQRQILKLHYQLAELRADAWTQIKTILYNITPHCIETLDTDTLRDTLAQIVETLQEYNAIAKNTEKNVQAKKEVIEIIYQGPLEQNNHPWNQHAKQLLQHITNEKDPDGFLYTLTDHPLYILQLIYYGMTSKNPKMITERDDIKKWTRNDADYPLGFEDTLHGWLYEYQKISPIRVMHDFTKDADAHAMGNENTPQQAAAFLLYRFIEIHTEPEDA